MARIRLRAMTPNQTLQELMTARGHILGILHSSLDKPVTEDLVQWAEALAECLCKELELRQALADGNVEQEVAALYAGLYRIRGA